MLAAMLIALIPAQEYPVALDEAYPVVQPQKKATPTYAQMSAKAIKDSSSFAVLVAGEKRLLSVPVHECATYGTIKEPATVLCIGDGKALHCFRVNANLTDTEVTAELRRLERQVRQPAAPFDKSGNTARPDDSVWLSREDSDAIKAAWPKTLAFPSTLRFYELPRRYQSLTTMNNGRTKLRDIEHLHDHSATLALSGGMEKLSGWRSVKGLAIPEGKAVHVWEENTDVRAFALVPRWRWSFPVGTVAYDALFNTESGKAFEIRTSEKADDGWAYRVAFRDKDQYPRGYQGAIGKACRECHSQPASVVDVPGQIYRHVVWGDDERFSWRPFGAYGELDTRWPIERK